MFKKLIALITSFFIVEQVASANEVNGDKILLNTSKGEIIINLMPEIAPAHVARIVLGSSPDSCAGCRAAVAGIYPRN